MTLSINTNIAATRASQYLAKNHASLQKSLDRLSSGKRITDPSDDAGGLAVAMKLEHKTKLLTGVSNGISNAISLLQVQDGALKSVSDIVSRIGELQAMYKDVTKSADDKATYDSEFGDLQDQLAAIEQNTKFNGIDVFGGADPEAFLDENLSNSNGFLAIKDPEILGADGTDLAALQGFASLNDIPDTGTAGNVSDTLDEVAGHRATNGGQVGRLQIALANVQSQITNITAAKGRILDVDIAAESSNLAKQQILVQASASMVAQANSANNVALQLLQ